METNLDEREKFFEEYEIKCSCHIGYVVCQNCYDWYNDHDKFIGRYKGLIKIKLLKSEPLPYPKTKMNYKDFIYGHSPITKLKNIWVRIKAIKALADRLKRSMRIS